MHLLRVLVENRNIVKSLAILSYHYASAFQTNEIGETNMTDLSDYSMCQAIIIII